MKKINNFEELNKLISMHLKKGVFTNCFISKEEFYEEIKSEDLFYHEYDGGLLLFRKIEDYYKMNFYINNPDIDLDINFDDVVVTEIVCRPELECCKFIELFKKNGMKLKLKRVRLLNEISNVDITSSNIEKGNLKDYEKIIKLLRENFDKYIGCIPSEQKLKSDIESGNFYCYREMEEILGILHIADKNNIKHLAVDKKYRSRGIAKVILSTYLSDVGDGKKYVWTGEDNIAALNTYFSMGYKLDGYVSYVLTNNV